jgi:hypothetical protein
MTWVAALRMPEGAAGGAGHGLGADDEPTREQEFPSEEEAQAFVEDWKAETGFISELMGLDFVEGEHFIVTIFERQEAPAGEEVSQ